MRGQVGYRKADVQLFQDEIRNGADEGLKAFAPRSLPKIQEHLEEAAPKLAGSGG